MLKKKILLIFGLVLCFSYFNTQKKEVQAREYYQYTVYIDPGHGGYDGGANKNGVEEKDINLAISIYLKNYLEQIGVKVLMIRSSDIDFVEDGPGTKKKRDLDKRIEMINNSNADFFVSIHMNALPNSRWHGAQTFYYKNYEENKLLATCIQQNLIDVLKNTNRLPKTVNNLYLLKKVQKPGALVEAGFLSNPNEANLLNTPSYQSKVAYAIYLGILEYLILENNIPIY